METDSTRPQTYELSLSFDGAIRAAHVTQQARVDEYYRERRQHYDGLFRNLGVTRTILLLQAEARSQ